MTFSKQYLATYYSYKTNMDTLKPYREKAEAKAKKCVEDIIKRK